MRYVDNVLLSTVLEGVLGVEVVNVTCSRMLRRERCAVDGDGECSRSGGG